MNVRKYFSILKMGEMQQQTVTSPNTKALNDIKASFMKEDLSPWSEYVIDIFSAYGLTPTGLTSEEIFVVLSNIFETKKTFRYLLEVIKSNRYPYTVMMLASKIKM